MEDNITIPLGNEVSISMSGDTARALSEAILTTKTWSLDDFELQFQINLGEECEAVIGNSEYYTLRDGSKLEIVKGTIVKIDGDIVGTIVPC